MLLHSHFSSFHNALGALPRLGAPQILHDPRGHRGCPHDQRGSACFHSLRASKFKTVSTASRAYQSLRLATLRVITGRGMQVARELFMVGYGMRSVDV